MKKGIVISLLCLTACSGELNIYTDSDPAYNVANFQTFDWLEKTNIEAAKNPVYYNELNDKRIKQAVERELQSRNYVRDDSMPEMLIHYHILLEDKVGMIPVHEGATYGPYWQQTPLYSYAYKQGTLIIDVMDTQNNLVWRGSAASMIEEVYTPERKTELINKAISKMFKKFPVSKRRQHSPS